MEQANKSGALKAMAEFSSFAALDLRVGKIVRVEESQAKKPTYRITADFGPSIGEKVTVAAYRHYPAADLVGLSIVGVMNIGVRKMGPETSEFLFLGAPDEHGDAVPVTLLGGAAVIGGGVF